MTYYRWPDRSWVAGTVGYCFSGSPSLTCISLKFDVHCVSKNPCDYVFDDNLNSKRPIVIIFDTVIT